VENGVADPHGRGRRDWFRLLLLFLFFLEGQGFVNDVIDIVLIGTLMSKNDELIDVLRAGIVSEEWVLYVVKGKIRKSHKYVVIFYLV